MRRTISLGMVCEANLPSCCRVAYRMDMPSTSGGWTVDRRIAEFLADARS